VTATTTTTPRTQTAVLVEQVVCRFGDRVVLDHLELKIEDDELVVLFGPSGCGKSTLLRLLAGLDKPDGGRIEVPAERASCSRVTGCCRGNAFSATSRWACAAPMPTNEHAKR
jgi:ABC-type transporter Mla maintaining outer membrane lipid asymmetry ATPase subunit MlaF